MNLGKSVVTALAFLCGALPLAAEVLHIDLATESDSTVSVESGVAYLLQIDNMVPRIRDEYAITMALEAVPIPPITFPSSIDPNICPDPSSLVNAGDETDVRRQRKLLEIGLSRLPEGTHCPIAEAAIHSTVFLTQHTYSLRSGQRLRVTVERADGDGRKKWEKTFTTGPRGHWLTSYGFTFLPDKNEDYFSKPIEETATYEITRKNDVGGAEFAPSIFFTWLPSNKRLNNWVIGPTAGLGFNLEVPVAFLGVSVMYNQNLQLVAGLAAHQQKRLRGEYDSGQVIEESLSSDQLTEGIFRPNAFVGVTFRFTENPFAKSDGTEKTGSDEK